MQKGMAVSCRVVVILFFPQFKHRMKYVGHYYSRCTSQPVLLQNLIFENRKEIIKDKLISVVIEIKEDNYMQTSVVFEYETRHCTRHRIGSI